MTLPFLKPKNGFNSDYEWFLKTDMNEYADQWVAILDKKVIANDSDLRKLLKKVKKIKSKEPTFTKIQSGHIAMY